MKKIAIQASSLTPSIYIGRLSKKGDVFQDKENKTDEVLGAVAKYVTEHWDGALEMTFANPDVVMTITVKDAPESE